MPQIAIDSVASCNSMIRLNDSVIQTWQGGGRKPASKQLLCCKEHAPTHFWLFSLREGRCMYHQPSRICCPTTLPEAELNIHVRTARLWVAYGRRLGSWIACPGALKVRQVHRAMTVPSPEAELNSHATIEWLWVVHGFGLKSIEAPTRFKPWLFHCQKQNWTAMVEG